MADEDTPLAHQLGRELLEKRKLPARQLDRFEQSIASLTKALQPLARNVVQSVVSDVDIPEAIFELSDKQLVKFFEAFFGSLGPAAVETWKALGRGIYLPFNAPRPYRSPNNPKLTRPRQAEWLKRMLELFMDYPPEVTTAEGLAVWAPYFDANPGGHAFLGFCFEGGEYAAHIGRLLGQLIDMPGTASANVLDTLRLSVEDRHPGSMFGLHVIYAFWNSRQEEVHGLLFDRLTGETTEERQLSIVRGAAEASIDLIRRLMHMVQDTESMHGYLICREFMTWFGLSSLPSEASVLLPVLELAYEALDRGPGAEPGSLEEVEQKVLYAWSLMVKEVEDAVPVLAQAIESTKASVRPTVWSFIDSAAHPCMAELFMRTFDLPDGLAVMQALKACRETANKHFETTRKPLLAKVIETCRRIDAQKQDYADLFDEEPPAFYEHLQAILRRLWDDESLTLLGPLAQNPALSLSGFLRAGYIAPDDFSIEAILAQVESPLESLAEILQNSPMKPEHWCELLQKKNQSYHSVEKAYAKLFAERRPDQFQSVFSHALAHPKSSMRAMGLTIVVELLSGPLAKAAEQLVRTYLAAEPASKSISEDEAQLRLKLQVRFATEQSAPAFDESVPPECRPSAKVEAFYPGLQITPFRPPVYRPLERMTDSCRELLLSLDQFLEANKQRYWQLAVADHGEQRMPTLEHSRVWDWPDSSKHELLSWWDEQGKTLAQPADLARLSTYWKITANFTGLTIPEGLDLSRLAALQTYLFEAVFPQWAYNYAVQQIPETEEVKFWRNLRNPRMVTQGFNYIWEFRGDWDDVDFGWDMAESIWAAVPEELRDKEKHGVKFLERIRAEDWKQRPRCLYNALRPDNKPMRRYSQLTERQDPIQAYIYGVGALGDVAEFILKLQGADAIPTIIEYEDVANIRRDPVRAEEWNRFFGHLADKIIDAELNRPAKELSEWSRLAPKFEYLEGFERFERLLLATAKKGFTRPTQSLSNQGSLWTRIAAVIYPEPECDPHAVAEKLKGLVKKRKVSEDHLLSAALLAPQWCEAIGLALEWPKLTSVVEWFLNHLQHEHFAPDIAQAMWFWSSLREQRQKQDAEGYRGVFFYTWYEKVLSRRADKIEEAGYRNEIHVSWFYEIATDVTDKQWERLFKASEVLMTPKSATELKTLVQAMLGQCSREDLLAQVRAAKKPVDVRPLALLPLATGSAKGLDVMERYKAIKDYRKVSRRFMDGELEVERADYAINLLVFRAGAENEDELDWMMQAVTAQKFAELREFTSGDIQVTLVVDSTGKPANHITKAGKVMKTIPTAVKKEKGLEEQQLLLKSLQKFATHSRRVLQRALAEKRMYTRAELDQMMAHPVLARYLESLLFTDGTNVGLFVNGAGGVLLSRDEQRYPLSTESQLRLAHPVDLIAHGGWIRWRDWLRERQVTQSIPQVERGMFLHQYFPISEDPRADRATMFSYSFEEPQFRAVLRSSGWDTEEERYERRLSEVEVFAEVDLHYQLFGGVQVSGIRFTGWRVSRMVEIAREEIPLIDFSETVRDVYQAATASASKSSSELVQEATRTIREFIAAKGLQSVRADGDRFIIDGQLGSYAIDLSAHEIQMAPSQYIPIHMFADNPIAGLIAAIEVLSNEETERETLQRLRLLT